MNKSPSRLVLLTPFYPYTVKKFSYDYYIGNEIRVLSRKFNKILVISTNSSETILPGLPPNVEVNAIKKTGEQTFFSNIQTLFSVWFWKELYRVFTKEKKFSIAVLKECFKYFSGVNFYRKKLGRILRGTAFEEEGTLYYSYWSLNYGTALGLMARKKKIPFVSRVHSLDIYHERYDSGYLPARVLHYQLSRMIFSISDQAKSYYQHLLERHAIPAEKLLTSRLAVGEAGPFQPVTGTRSRIVILSNSWIQPIKRLDKLIMALGMIQGTEIDWYHIGDDYGRGYMAGFEQMIKEYLADAPHIQVHLMGALNHGEIFEFYASHEIDLIINTSDYEGIPVSIMEAFAFSVPAIATNVGGVPEIVQDGYNGFLLEKECTHADVYNALVKYIGMTVPERNIFRKNAYDTWKEKYNDEKNYTLLSSYLENLETE